MYHPSRNIYTRSRTHIYFCQSYFFVERHTKLNVTILYVLSQAVWCSQYVYVYRHTKMNMSTCLVFLAPSCLHFLRCKSCLPVRLHDFMPVRLAPSDDQLVLHFCDYTMSNTHICSHWPEGCPTLHARIHLETRLSICIMDWTYSTETFKYKYCWKIMYTIHCNCDAKKKSTGLKLTACWDGEAMIDTAVLDMQDTRHAVSPSHASPPPAPTFPISRVFLMSCFSYI